ncbi:hypothetical protein Tco_0004164 [Tanacetum coccineum]
MNSPPHHHHSSTLQAPPSPPCSGAATLCHTYLFKEAHNRKWSFVWFNSADGTTWFALAHGSGCHVETILTMSPENKAHYESEKEAIHLLLTGIGDEINSTVDACKIAHEMWIAIERLQQVSSTTLTRMVKTGQFRNQGTVIVAEARETVGSQEVPTSDSGTNTEPLEQVQNNAEYNVFANVRHNSEQSESTSDICLVEKDDSNVTPDSLDMCDNDIQTDQNAEDERAALANLIINLKFDVDENKKIQNQLKKANASLAQELKECKSILAETSKTLGESNSIRDSCLIALQNKQTEFERYKALNDRIVDYDKLKPWEKHSYNHFRAPTALDMEVLIKTCLMPLAIKTQNDSFTFVHELKQEMHADLKYVESLENEIDELESDKAEFSNMYDILLQECVSNDVIFAKLEKHSISLELALQQCQEQMKNATVCKEKTSNVFLKEHEQYFEIQDLKAQLQDKNIAISELKKLVEKCKGKSVEIKFDKPCVVRQPNAQRIPKPSIFGKSAPFSASLERKRVIHKTTISRPQRTQIKDKVVPNNSQVKDKKNEVEDHPRISSISNKTKSVTACNDNLKSRTLNVNAFCATSGKCVFNSNHDACVSKYLNEVNARTKKPKVVSISTRKPKSQANKSVATPPKKIVASKSTT